MPTLSQPLNVRNADLKFTQNSAVLQNVNAALGQSTATGQITVRNFAAPNVQFTLAADTRSGTRAGFSTAADPPRARQLFERHPGVAQQALSGGHPPFALMILKGRLRPAPAPIIPVGRQRDLQRREAAAIEGMENAGAAENAKLAVAGFNQRGDANDLQAIGFAIAGQAIAG